MASRKPSTSSAPDLSAAIRFAAEAHAGQTRDGEAPLPYIVHPIEVLANLRNIGQVTDPISLCAAILHDVLEETPTTIEALARAFGPECAALVQELTRYEPTAAETKGLTKAEIWALRSQTLLAEIEEMGPQAQAIKLADRLSNLKGAERTKTKPKLARYLAQTEEILRTIPKSVNPALWEAIQNEISLHRN